MYDKYRQETFILGGHEGIVICPEHPRADRAYIWRTEFLGKFDYADRALLKKGWHLVCYKISDQFGSPDAVEKMHSFQEYLEKTYALKDKAVLFGFSRGGLYAVNYAAAYPDRVWKIYLDAPVLDIYSWPAGMGQGKGSAKDWALCKEIYQIADGSTDCQENPIHKIRDLIRNRIPVLIVAGDVDEIVPFEENGKQMVDEYTRAGVPIVCIMKKGVGHHPHSLEDPQPIVEWVCKTNL